MFIIDTNFLINDYKNLELLEGDILIPITVVRELDNRKNDVGHVGYNSRKSLRLINDAIDNNNKIQNGNSLVIDNDEYSSIQKTMISRAGEGSKVVCCGDICQIDNNQSKYTNGLFMHRENW